MYQYHMTTTSHMSADVLASHIICVLDQCACRYLNFNAWCIIVVVLHRELCSKMSDSEVAGDNSDAEIAGHGAPALPRQALRPVRQPASQVFVIVTCFSGFWHGRFVSDDNLPACAPGVDSMLVVGLALAYTVLSSASNAGVSEATVYLRSSSTDTVSRCFWFH